MTKHLNLLLIVVFSLSLPLHNSRDFLGAIQSAVDKRKWLPRLLTDGFSEKLPFSGFVPSPIPMLRVWSEKDSRRVNNPLRYSKKCGILKNFKVNLISFSELLSKTVRLQPSANIVSVGKHPSWKQISLITFFWNYKISLKSIANVDP